MSESTKKATLVKMLSKKEVISLSLLFLLLISDLEDSFSNL